MTLCWSLVNIFNLALIGSHIFSTLAHGPVTADGLFLGKKVKVSTWMSN